MKLSEMSIKEMEDLERQLAYLLDDYGHLTLQQFHDLLGDTIEPAEEGAYSG